MQKTSSKEMLKSSSIDKTNKAKITSLAKKTGAALLLLTASIPAGSAENVEAYKTDGPYVAAEYDLSGDIEYAEVDYSGDYSDALRLSDTFDGMLSTSGYAVLFDRQKIAEMLNEDEVATIEQVSHYQDIDTGVRSTRDDREVIGPKSINGEDPRIWRDQFIPVHGGSSGMTSRPEVRLLNETGLTVLGEGADVHTYKPTEIVLSKYKIHDGVDELVDQRTATVELRPLVECDDGINVATEVVLTPTETAEACEVIEEYDSLLPDGSHIALDAIMYPNHAADSANLKSLRLSFPNRATEVWPDYDVDSAALHEALHVGYLNLPEDSPARQKANEAYKRILQTMDYKMPDRQAVYEQQVGDVEPVWAVITESTYVGEGSRAGHPWDNTTEMVSSALTVKTLYPYQMIERISQLGSSQQIAVSTAIKASYDVFSAAGGDSEKVIKNYIEVKEVLDKL